MTDREMALLWLESFAKNKEPMTLIPKQLIRLMYEALKKQPEIVRCKDCKKHGSYDCHITSLTSQTSSGDWYCADGERSE